MNESRRMLAEMADPLFAELGPDATEESDGARIDELGLPLLLVPESEGGFGCSTSTPSAPGTTPCSLATSIGTRF